MVTGYFGFSLKFIEEDKYYAKEFFIEDGGINNIHRQKSTWSFLGILFSSIIIFTCMKVSLTDTSDKRVMKESKERDMSYSMVKGIPVVVDGWCSICRSNVTFILFVTSTFIASTMSFWLAINAIGMYFNSENLMDMTTVEYLSHQQQRKYYSDNYEDEDDENPWRRPYYHNPWKRWIMSIIRKVYKMLYKEYEPQV
ncbi:21414_t:CDS:2 [Gigaspora rosea]|nr:21414_t:CDS:2 [Gigaspora rosea]